MGGTAVERYACRRAPRRVCANRAQTHGQRRAGRACRIRRLHQIRRASLCDSRAPPRSPQEIDLLRASPRGRLPRGAPPPPPGVAGITPHGCSCVVLKRRERLRATPRALQLLRAHQQWAGVPAKRPAPAAGRLRRWQGGAWACPPARPASLSLLLYRLLANCARPRARAEGEVSCRP